MANFVERLYPNFPQDRKVVETLDHTKYYKIDYNKKCMYVPTEKTIRFNLHLIDTFMDAVEAFAHADLTAPPNWEDTHYETDEGSEFKALYLLDSLLHMDLRTEENPDSILGLDIETKHIAFKNNKMLALGIAYTPRDVIIITVFTTATRDKLQQLFSRPSEETRDTWHNGKFDTGRMKWLEGINARVDEDTMLMHYVGINERRGTHGLKELGSIYLQAPAWDDQLNQIKKDYCKKHRILLRDFTYDMFPKELLYKYLHFDCLATFRLYYVFKKLMRPTSRFIYRKLIEASNVYREVELAGVAIDVNYLEDLEYQFEKDLVDAERKMKEVVRDVWKPLEYARDTGAKATAVTPFNPGSPKQLKWLLEKVTGRVLPGTDKATLADLEAEIGDDQPVVAAIMKLRKLHKYMDTYVAGFRDLMCEDGRIHGTYNLHGTETGRLSSSDPNMQNIPRDKTIKNLIVAEDGYKLVQLDYSQAELRVLAYLSGDDFLTGVYQRDEDLHDAVALQMFGPGFTKEQRVQAKTINFGIAYGRGPASLQQTFKISISEARALINNWFAQMPKVKSWIANQRSLALDNVVPSTPLGRERHFTITYEALNHVQNEYVNFPIQSIASDMTMLSLITIYNWIVENNLQNDVRIILSVHDSIVLEVAEDIDGLVDRVAKVATEIMRTTPQKYLKDCRVPFKADAEVGYSWGALEAWKDDL